MDKEILKGILEYFKNATFLFLILGVILVLARANKGYSKIGVNIPTAWTIPIGSIGVVLILVAIALLFLKNENISISKRTLKEYGIRLSYPIHSTSLYSPITVSGLFEDMPPAQGIYAVEYNPNTLKYWPKKRLSYNSHDKTWTSQMSIGSGDNKSRVLIIAYHGKDSLKLVEYYSKASEKTNRHIGIDEFPGDFHRLVEVTITLKPDP